nr:Cytochrome P450 [uncultured organism]
MSNTSEQEAPRSPPAREIPVDGTRLDATLSLLREGYAFIPNRMKRLQTNIFRTRLMMRDTLCLSGPAAAELFYGGDGATRIGAMPQTVLRLLQDRQSVQQLEGEDHRHRKALFIRLLMQDEDGLARLVALFNRTFLERLPGWETRDRVVLSDEIEGILAETAFRWTGTPLARVNLEQDGRTLGEMVHGAGRFGPRNWRALLRRNRLEARLRAVIEDIRDGKVSVADGSPIDSIAQHRDRTGTLLPPRTATVELINILRPIVAIGRYIVFAALALHENDEWRRLLAAGNDALLPDFAEEVRRISPFFPFVGAVATRALDFEGHRIEQGQWLLLDLYGTTHDEALFPEPHRFKPHRILSWRDKNFAFIPQGAGDVATTHRCPGEQVTVEILMEAVRILTREMTYEVPTQSFDVSLRRVPAVPESGFVMASIRQEKQPAPATDEDAWA